MSLAVDRLRSSVHTWWTPQRSPPGMGTTKGAFGVARDGPAGHPFVPSPGVLWRTCPPRGHRKDRTRRSATKTPRPPRPRPRPLHGRRKPRNLTRVRSVRVQLPAASAEGVDTPAVVEGDQPPPEPARSTTRTTAACFRCGWSSVGPPVGRGDTFPRMAGSQAIAASATGASRNAAAGCRVHRALGRLGRAAFTTVRLGGRVGSAAGPARRRRVRVVVDGLPPSGHRHGTRFEADSRCGLRAGAEATSSCG